MKTFRCSGTPSSPSSSEGKFDEGLVNGVQAIGLTLSVAAKGGKLADLAEARSATRRSSTSSRGAAGGLRSWSSANQVRLTLEGARAIIAGAEAKAAELKLKQNIAVVDDGGHLLAFARMDGARPASGYTAITKATSAATFRAETGPIAKDRPARPLAEPQPPERRRGQRGQDHDACSAASPSSSAARSSAPSASAGGPASKTPRSPGRASTRSS